jgi:hypothetical protein
MFWRLLMRDAIDRPTRVTIFTSSPIVTVVPIRVLFGHRPFVCSRMC